MLAPCSRTQEFASGAASAPAVDFVEDFKSKFRIRVIEDTDEECSFDVMGIDAPLANALRRILIAEVGVDVCGLFDR